MNEMTAAWKKRLKQFNKSERERERENTREGRKSSKEGKRIPCRICNNSRELMSYLIIAVAV